MRAKKKMWCVNLANVLEDLVSGIVSLLARAYVPYLQMVCLFVGVGVLEGMKGFTCLVMRFFFYFCELRS